ncbi:hypothetical protein LMG27952_04962 [Paraburkholderia hiiakae]|uniref:Uncharacterized protein n=1 Tax=Paraburkholderia hiiakae TaxID=1081782 RepID=A0ABM8NZ09_9BURK|nr:hypothetical protein [Paraburkholderia hiiakae]CAD6550084.1 hypothetical protein LMG27952_04962 [Paraburkholderia hiiakae]
MNDRKPAHDPALSSDGADSACPPIVGFAMTALAPGSGKTMYAVFRRLAEERRRIRGADDTPYAGDEACA